MLKQSLLTVFLCCRFIGLRSPVCSVLDDKFKRRIYFETYITSFLFIEKITCRYQLPWPQKWFWMLLWLWLAVCCKINMCKDRFNIFKENMLAVYMTLRQLSKLTKKKNQTFVSYQYHALERMQLVKITLREFLSDILNTNSMHFIVRWTGTFNFLMHQASAFKLKFYVEFHC